MTILTGLPGSRDTSTRKEARTPRTASRSPSPVANTEAALGIAGGGRTSGSGSCCAGAGVVAVAGVAMTGAATTTGGGVSLSDGVTVTSNGEPDKKNRHCTLHPEPTSFFSES